MSKGFWVLAIAALLGIAPASAQAEALSAAPQLVVEKLPERVALADGNDTQVVKISLWDAAGNPAAPSTIEFTKLSFELVESDDCYSSVEGLTECFPSQVLDEAGEPTETSVVIRYTSVEPGIEIITPWTFYVDERSGEYFATTAENVRGTAAVEFVSELGAGETAQPLGTPLDDPIRNSEPAATVTVKTPKLAQTGSSIPTLVLVGTCLLIAGGVTVAAKRHSG
jgi:LPXTG-motif cell wall-anchored protein